MLKKTQELLFLKLEFNNNNKLIQVGLIYREFINFFFSLF